MQISQIYLSDSDADLPQFFSQCVERVKAAYPNFRHVLYDDAGLREFIGASLGAEVLAAYEKLNPFAYRADLARYCLLYEFGGWYFDIAVTPLIAINIGSDVDTLAFREPPTVAKTSWGCNNAVLFARSKHPVFETAIRQVVENCRTEYYGITSLCPTGPNLLGRAFALHGADPRCLFGDLCLLTALHHRKNLGFVLPDGTLLARGKPEGSLASLGAKGTNDYNDFYNSRTVYRNP